MIPRTCSLHAQLTRELRSRDLSASMRHHAATCDVCSSTLLVDSLLEDLERTTSIPHDLPGADSVWWRSQVLRKLARNRKTSERRPQKILALAAASTPAWILLIAIGWQGVRQLGEVDLLFAPIALGMTAVLIAPFVAWLMLWLADDLIATG